MTSKKRLLSMILILVMMFSLFSSASIPPAAAQGIEEEEVGPELPETPEPTAEPTLEPTPEPIVEPTPEPAEEPAIEPAPEPEPTAEPMPEPTAKPTPEPTPDPKHITETGTAYAPVTVVGAGTVTGYEEISGYQVTIDNAWSNTNTATSPSYSFRFGENGSPNLPAITCHAVKKDGVTTPVFCVQPNRAANDDSPHTMYDDLSSFAVWGTMTANQKQLLKLALACGYPNTTDSSISANEQWAAMQTMVFDIIVGFVRYDGSSIIKAAKSSGGANFIDEDWAGREVQGAAWTSITDGLQGNPTGVKTAYNNILSRMQNARLSAVGQPDFGLITLNYDAASGNYKGTATASNGNAAYYNFAYNSGGVTVTQSGNTVTVTMTPAAAANYTTAKYLPEVNSTVGYYTISDGKYCGYSSTSSSTSYQSFLGINGTNPINYSKAKLQVKANIANGSITINKTSGKPSVSDNNSNYKYNAKYGVYSDAACTTLVKEVTLTSGTNKGTAKVTGLALGTYYVKEISAPAGFQINATASAGITLTAANTDGTANMTDEPLTGSLTIIKTSSDPSLTDGRSAYQYNAVYGVYSNAACTAEVTRVTLNSETNQGKATVNDLPFGTYYVKEITAPTGFELNPTPSAAVTVSESTASSAVSFGTANVERGTLNDATGALGSSNEKRLRTRNFITLEPGTYYISNEQGWWLAYYLYSADSAHSYYKDESHYSWIKGSEVLLNLSEPRCIKLVWRNAAETTLSPADITGEGILKNVVTVSMTDPPITRPFTLQKRSANTDMTDGNSCYSLEGAQYGVYARASDANADRNRVEILTTDADGNATSSQSYALGTWYVKELVASPGYMLDQQVHEVIVTAVEADNVFTVTEEPGGDPDEVKIQKVSYTGSSAKLITSGSAVFKVEFYPNNNWSESPLRTWYYKTVDGVCSLLNESYLDTTRDNSDRWYSFGGITYPLGTIKITEVEAPAGYIRTDLVWLAQVTQDSPGAKGTWHWVTPEGGLVSYTADGPTLENEHRNGTLEVLKLDHLGNALPGVTFRLEYSTDGGTTWARTYKIEPDALTDYGACKSADLVDGELTTGADGKAVFEGLMADGEILYRLTEVKAPAGFSLLKDPVYEGTLPVPVDRDDLPDSEVIDGQAYSYTLTCRVTDTSQFVLPVSGGRGFVFLPLAMATAALGMALILTDGRRKSRE